ncbi:MAG: exo-alpha-sialidase [Saprospiraceae bacterium]|nr:exo-alpha-sialidase [Saprospiraceae bacterium]
MQRLAKINAPQPFLNVLIDSTTSGIAYKPCEPSIYINPTDPDNIVAGIVLNKTLHSFDGGKTWSMQFVDSPYGVYGDPVIMADYLGNFYFAHLADPAGKGRATESWIDRIVVQKSSDGGKSWNEGSYTGHRPPADQDKHWLAVDPRNNHLYVTWTEFDKYGSNRDSDHSRILFSKSIDQAESWSEPLAISQLEGDCLDGDNTTEGAVPTVGPAGEIYVAWSLTEKIYFDRSLDGGITWLDKDILVTPQYGGWDIDIPGLGRANGMPVTACDISKSQFRGHIYINYCDQKNGTGDTDVWLVKSTDGGTTWSSPLRVNDDRSTSHQFFTWMTVDQTSGAIYIVFYDRRNYKDLNTDVFLAYSFDGGASFTNVKISEEPFIPNTNLFFGDYNNISSFDGIVRPIWTRVDGDKTSIWTALINF